MYLDATTIIDGILLLDILLVNIVIVRLLKDEVDREQ